METKPVPSHPSLEQYRKQAKDLVKAHRSASPQALERIRAYHPAFAGSSPQQVASRPFQLSGAQLVIAREHGFESWPKFKGHIEALNFKRKSLLANDPSAVFLEAACIPMGEWHSSGTLEAAEALLAQKPEIAEANIYVSAALGDASGVRRFLAVNPKLATLKGGPHEWDALTYLCFSRYLRLDRTRSDGFVRASHRTARRWGKRQHRLVRGERRAHALLGERHLRRRGPRTARRVDSPAARSRRRP